MKKVFCLSLIMLLLFSLIPFNVLAVYELPVKISFTSAMNNDKNSFNSYVYFLDCNNRHHVIFYNSNVNFTFNEMLTLTVNSSSTFNYYSSDNSNKFGSCSYTTNVKIISVLKILDSKNFSTSEYTQDSFNSLITIDNNYDSSIASHYFFPDFLANNNNPSILMYYLCQPYRMCRNYLVAVDVNDDIFVFVPAHHSEQTRKTWANENYVYYSNSKLYFTGYVVGDYTYTHYYYKYNKSTSAYDSNMLGSSPYSINLKRILYSNFDIPNKEDSTTFFSALNGIPTPAPSPSPTPAPIAGGDRPSYEFYRAEFIKPYYHGFKDTANIWTVTVFYRIPFSKNNTYKDVSVDITGFNDNASLKKVDSHNFNILDGFAEGTLTVSGEPIAGVNKEFNVKVIAPNGQEFTDKRIYTYYTDFVDEDGDGLDDRTGFDDTKYIPPPPASAGAGWSIKRFVDGVGELFDGAIGLVSNTGTLVGSLGTVMSTTFSFVPSPIIALLTLGFIFAVLLRIFGR